MKRYAYMLALAYMLILLFSAAAFAADDAGRAREMGEMLVKLFAPETIAVTISEGGNFAWVEAKGAIIDKMRIEDLKLRAMIKNTDEPIDTSDSYALAKLIMMSKGELTLLEKDVNNIFQKDGIETKGFSHLAFDFKPKGFTAEGMFTAKFLFTIKIRLRAQGVLVLETDGIYIDDMAIFTEGVPTPDGLLKMVSDRINPLLSFSKIPFPVEFKDIKMTDTAVILTGYPDKFKGGTTWTWKKPAK